MQACFNEQIEHIVREHHAVFVKPQQVQDKSPGGKIEQQMIFARPIDQIPDFDRVVIGSGHDLAPIRRELDGGYWFAVGVGILANQLQCGCVGRQEASV